MLGWYRRRARRAGWADGHSGSVTVIQRFGSGLQLNVHSHALFLDGVFTEGADGTLHFHQGPAADRHGGRPAGGAGFWAKIAEGLSSEEVAIACGISGPVGVRWFRERGGMPSIQLTPVSGRYLSFAEREDIALLRGQGLGVRAIARTLGRPPATISRELRRNAATRGGRSRS